MVDLTKLGSASGKEIYASVAQHPISVSTSKSSPAAIVEEEDDTSVAVKLGTPCRRNGCNILFVSDAKNRQSDGENAVCTYHPGLVRVPLVAMFWILSYSYAYLANIP
jgi:hypothetical protein